LISKRIFLVFIYNHFYVFSMIALEVCDVEILPKS